MAKQPKNLDEFTAEDWELLADLAKEEVEFVAETGRSKAHLEAMSRVLRKRAQQADEPEPEPEPEGTFVVGDAPAVVETGDAPAVEPDVDNEGHEIVS